VDQKILLEPSLHPRMLKGAHHGIDIWYSPLLLTSDEFLESKLQAPSTSKWIELQLTSTCKSVQSELEIELTSLKNRISLRAPLQVATQLCTEYPMICRMGLKEWWNFRYALPTIKLDFPLKKGDSFEVKFRPRGLNPKDCRLGFSKMEFKS
jgi:hypothetical protein